MAEEISRAVAAVTCQICGKPCEGGINLLSGTRVHNECHERLLERERNLRLKLMRAAASLRQAKKSAEDWDSLSDIFSSWLSGTERPSEKAKREILAAELRLSNEREDINTELSDIKSTIRPIYDEWPERPPDWHERSSWVIGETGYCENCGAGGGHKNPLQAHHILPISKGGNHDYGNIQVLCKKCHQKSHKHKFSSSGGSQGVFRKKLDAIQAAIDAGSAIAFRYRNRDGEVSRRTVRPFEVKKVKNTVCVRGFCELRGEDRSFAIKRISELRMAELSQRNCATP